MKTLKRILLASAVAALASCASTHRPTTTTLITGITRSHTTTTTTTLPMVSGDYYYPLITITNIERRRRLGERRAPVRAAPAGAMERGDRPRMHHRHDDGRQRQGRDRLELHHDLPVRLEQLRANLQGHRHGDHQGPRRQRCGRRIFDRVQRLLGTRRHGDRRPHRARAQWHRGVQKAAGELLITRNIVVNATDTFPDGVQRQSSLAMRTRGKFMPEIVEGSTLITRGTLMLTGQGTFTGPDGVVVTLSSPDRPDAFTGTTTARRWRTTRARSTGGPSSTGAAAAARLASSHARVRRWR